MKLIINADDFGRSSEINRAVVRAHREGILTSASLMAGGEAFEEAVELARQNPDLAVGLHVTVSNGRSVLPHGEIPGITDESGRFLDSAARAGLRYFFSRRAQAQLQRELRAQFERFAATGLHLSHVDGHQHMHVHPTVFRLLLPLAREFGAVGLRLPCEPIGPALRFSRKGVLEKLVLASIFRGLCRRARRRLIHEGFCIPPRCFGLLQSGRMQESYVLALLEKLDAPAEIYFHPSAGQRADARGPNPDDLAALISPAVRELIARRQLRLCTYFDFCEA